MKPRLTNHRTLAALDQTAKLFDVSAREIVGRRRQPSIIRARFALYASLYQACATSYQEIAAILKRDHTTVIHGHRQAVAMASVDPDYAAAIAQIAQVCR